MYAHQRDNKFRHYLRHKARFEDLFDPGKIVDYAQLPEVVQIFDTRKMRTILREHDRKGNLYRNHERYLKFLGETAGFLPLVSLRADIYDRLEALRVRFPNFSAAIDFYRAQFALARLADNAAFSANPLLLSGPAGVGKTAFCHELSRIVATHFELIALSSTTAGFVISGNSSGWSEGKPGKVVESLARGLKGNPLIVVDEIDKVGGDQRYDPLGSLYQLLERETAAHFIDEALEIGTDCSHIVWVGTANRLEKIPAPILSRFTVIEVERPTAAQMQNVLRSIYRNVRQNHAWGNKFSEELPTAVASKIIDSGLEPRLMQKELIAACGKAVLRQAEEKPGGNGGYELSPDDFTPREIAKKPVSVVMPIYRIAPVQDEPEETLMFWSVREARFSDPDDSSHHLVGYLPRRGHGRVTSAIKAFDRTAMCITTSSGRVYYLEGQPGINPDAEYVWNIWKEANGVQEEVDVTGQYCQVH